MNAGAQILLGTACCYIFGIGPVGSDIRGQATDESTELFLLPTALQVVIFNSLFIIRSIRLMFYLRY